MRPPLQARTIAAKGHAVIGVHTGTLLAPGRWRGGPRQIEPRWCTWTYPATSAGAGSLGHARGFHFGGPGRPPRAIVGWSATALSACQDLIRAARG